MKQPKWNELERELEPLIEVGIEDVKGRRGGDMMALGVMKMAMVRWAKSKEIERWMLGRDRVNEGRRCEEMMEELGDGAADDDLTEREGGEDLVERVKREMVDRREIHGRPDLQANGGFSELDDAWILKKQSKACSALFFGQEIGRAHV